MQTITTHPAGHAFRDAPSTAATGTRRTRDGAVVLGINSVYHESSAAIIVDGVVVAAVEEERFTRVKRGKPARVDNAHELPRESIAFCLREAGIEPCEIDAVAYSFSPTLRRLGFELDALSMPGGWGTAEGEARFQASLQAVPAAVATLLDEPVDDRFVWVPHHLAHAASAYYPSGFDGAAVLVVDGIGECSGNAMFAGAGAGLHPLATPYHGDSIGFLWEKLSTYLGFSEYDAGKVMGLAGYGRAADAPGFASFARIAGRAPRLDPAVLRFRLPDLDALEARLGRRRSPGASIDDRHIAVAAALQAFTDEALLALAHDLHDRHPVSRLCLAGGVALNCTSNTLLKERGPFEEIYIPSAPHDAGTAIGAALYVHAEISPTAPQAPVMPSAATGPAFDDGDVAAALRDAGLEGERSRDIAGEVAELVAGGAIVGWFEGRMEIGPRALGHRSLIADPRDPRMRDVINRKVKHREDFRPFAPSVLETSAGEWFEMGRPSRSYEYMLYTPPVRRERKAEIPAVVHVDGSARVQTVSATREPAYHRLIEAFAGRTGVPVVLNTSFNDCEPIVCTPSDAIATFMDTSIDAVALGDVIVRRPRS